MTRGKSSAGDYLYVVAILIAVAAAMAGMLAVFGAVTGYWRGLTPSVWPEMQRLFWEGFPWWVLGVFAFVGYGLLSAFIEERTWRHLVPALLWPKHAKTETTVLVRFGRVLHWLTIAPAALCLLAGILGTVQSWIWVFERHTQPDHLYLLFGMLGALAFLLIGRGLRYIFAGE